MATADSLVSSDVPIFDPDAWRLTSQQQELCERVRVLGAQNFAGRASRYDREASFPTENYKDLHSSGLLGICIPESCGGIGADLKTYMPLLYHKSHKRCSIPYQNSSEKL